MKNLILILALLILIEGCGKKVTPEPAPAPACSSLSSLGLWFDSSTNDTMTLKSDCTGTGTACNYKFRYSLPNSQGKINLIVDESNMQGSCLAKGTSICGFSLDKGILYVDCGNGGFDYEKL